VGQLAAFVTAYLSGARQMVEALEEAQASLEETYVGSRARMGWGRCEGSRELSVWWLGMLAPCRLSEASSRPAREVRPKSTYAYADDDDDDEDAGQVARGPRVSGCLQTIAEPSQSPWADVPADSGPCALAVYDFEAENEGELSFAEVGGVVAREAVPKGSSNGRPTGCTCTPPVLP
jgi:hypothetical protein